MSRARELLATIIHSVANGNDEEANQAFSQYATMKGAAILNPEPPAPVEEIPTGIESEEVEPAAEPEATPAAETTE